MIKVGVVFGGVSVEHEVSIISAVQAMNKLDTEKYEIIPIYITKDNEWYTGQPLKEIETYRDMDLLKRFTTNVVLYKKNDEFVLQRKGGLFKSVVNTVDVILPVVHGTNVEDGCLQGYFRTIDIPFAGSDVLASAIAQDKIVQKEIFECRKLPIAKYVWFYDFEYNEDPEEYIKRIEKEVKFPCIVKPATLGSSVGIASCANREALEKAIDEATKYDDKIIVEEKIENLTEVNISVLGTPDNVKLSAIEEVTTSDELLTFDDKYINGSKKGGSSKGMASAARKVPAQIDKKLEDEVRRVAEEAFRACNLSGDVRIDFLIDQKKKSVYINEINSCPGSLAFYLWDPIGKNFTNLLDDMINIAIKNYRKRKNKTHTFDSNILSGFQGGLKGTKGLKGKLR